MAIEIETVSVESAHLCTIVGTLDLEASRAIEKVLAGCVAAPNARALLVDISKAGGSHDASACFIQIVKAERQARVRDCKVGVLLPKWMINERTGVPLIDLGSQGLLPGLSFEQVCASLEIPSSRATSLLAKVGSRNQGAAAEEEPTAPSGPRFEEALLAGFSYWLDKLGGDAKKKAEPENKEEEYVGGGILGDLWAGLRFWMSMFTK